MGIYKLQAIIPAPPIITLKRAHIRPVRIYIFTI